MAKDFSAAINEIMPLVKDGDKSTPFIIARNKDGSWDVHYPYPAESTDSLLQKLQERDPYAVSFTGAGFAKGSFPYVYDKALSGRLRAEFDTYGAEAKEARAVLNFFEDRIGELSHQTTDYLATIDKPLAELVALCPHKMAIDNDEWTFNENLASKAIHYIENEVSARLQSIHPAEVKPEPRIVDGYAFAEMQSVRIGKISVVLAECHNPTSPYLVCNRVDGKDYNHSSFPGHISAMREFTARQTTLTRALEAHGQPARGNEPSSLLGALNDAKAEAAARNDAPKDRPQTKKRGDMEI